MTDTTFPRPARTIVVSEVSKPLDAQAHFDEFTGKAVMQIHQLACRYSIRLDILQSTVRAFKSAVENAGRAPLETYYVVNLMEAIEALVPDTEGFMDSAQEAIGKVDDLWRDLAVPQTASTTPDQPAGSQGKRARREATAGSAA